MNTDTFNHLGLSPELRILKYHQDNLLMPKNATFLCNGIDILLVPEAFGVKEWLYERLFRILLIRSHCILWNCFPRKTKT